VQKTFTHLQAAGVQPPPGTPDDAMPAVRKGYVTLDLGLGTLYVREGDSVRFRFFPTSTSDESPISYIIITSPLQGFSQFTLPGSEPGLENAAGIILFTLCE
jgi:hypothetical protein